MTDGEILLRAVCECPDDDLPRLLYADWCEQQGRDARAEFIRLQLANAAAGLRCPLVFHSATGAPLPCGCCSACLLRLQEQPLSRKAEVRLELPFDHAWIVDMPADGRWPRDNHGPFVWYDRGFVQGALLTCKTFMQHAPELFSRHPIIDVVLADRRCALHPRGPNEARNERVGWWSSDMQHIELPHVPPNPLFDLLEGGERYSHYLTGRRLCWPAPEENAYAALGRACVAYARQQVGLPPLP